MEWRIDPENPAEVLACAGLAHVAWRSDRHARTGFVIGAAGEVRFEAPQLAELSRPLELEEMEPDGVRLGGVGLDWWCPWGLNPALKTWSGRQTGWTVHRSLRAAAGRSAPGEWLTFEAPATDRRKARLGLDPASNWTTLKLRWSANEHYSVHMCCRAWAELLASVGLQAFALRGSRGAYRYHLWRAAALPAAVAAFGGRGRCVHSLAGYRVTTGKNGRTRCFAERVPFRGSPANPDSIRRQLMTVSIREIIGDEDLVALRYHQALEPVEGRGAVVDPPTYPGPRVKRGGAERRSEYVINNRGDGARICDLDTVQSQANRMEASYRRALADLIPRHVVEAGGRRVDLTELPHRLADASIRATGLAIDIRASLEAFAAGDAPALARLGPTSLVYGAWDSRDTRVSVPRVIASRITAHDVVECTRSAQYTGAFRQEELGLSDREWRKASKAGFAPSPATGRPGGSGCGRRSCSRRRACPTCCGGTGRRIGARCCRGISSRSRSGGSSSGGVGTTFGPGARSCRRAPPPGRRCTWRASGERSRSMPRR